MDKLTLRFHQKLIIEKIIKLINNGIKSILIAAKPRSGKTYMVGGLILHLSLNQVNILVITPAPKETMDQYVKEMFLSFSNFDKLNIINPLSSSELMNIKLSSSLSNIIIISKQVLQRVDRVKSLKNISAIFFDESHFGGTSEISANMIDMYRNKNTIIIYLTATFKKPIEKFNITNILNWDIEDEQLCKTKNIRELINRHGSIVSMLLNSSDELDIYKIYPNMLILSVIFDNRFINKFKQLLKSETYNIDMSKLFTLKNGKFKYNDIVELFLKYISTTIFSRIINISNEYESRTKLTNEYFTTQIWFLPPGNVNECSLNIIKLSNNNKILCKFAFLILNNENSNIKNIKDYIKEVELEAKRKRYRGLIILVGNMLQLGITLTNCDIVIQLNNTKSYDKITQSIYRCMSEAENKKFGFIIDFNINRVIESLLIYNTYNMNFTTNEKINYLITNKIINIDIDQADQDQLIKKLLQYYNNDPINEYEKIIRFVNKLEIIKLFKYLNLVIKNDLINNQIKQYLLNLPSLNIINKFLHKLITNLDKYNLKTTSTDIIEHIYDLY